MKWFDWWKKFELDDELRDFEVELENALSPVSPRQDFVAGLRSNLMRQNFEISLTPETQNQKLQTGILVAGGILSAIVMVLTGLRGVISIVGIVGLLVGFIKQNPQEAPAPTNFAH